MWALRQGRFSGKNPDGSPGQASADTILKDLDLDMKLKLPEEWHQRRGPPLPARAAAARMLSQACTSGSTQVTPGAYA